VEKVNKEIVVLRKKVEGECMRKGEREKREAVRKETRAKEKGS
jgi:hypothetical protein